MIITHYETVEAETHFAALDVLKNYIEASMKKGDMGSLGMADNILHAHGILKDVIISLEKRTGELRRLQPFLTLAKLYCKDADNAIKKLEAGDHTILERIGGDFPEFKIPPRRTPVSSGDMDGEPEQLKIRDDFKESLGEKGNGYIGG